jgi:Protein of unknown function (DUF2785)
MIDRPSVLCSVIVLIAIGSGPAAVADPVPHDKSYWQAVMRDYAVPSGEAPLALARELSALLGSPDPELRDQIAFGILSVWLSGDVPWTDAELIALLDEWQGNLRVGPDQLGSDAVLKRSFSALCLAVLAERDLKTPFLGPQRYHALLDAALAYLAAERDLRGYDEHKGWIHATAHTADLLAALARHPDLKPAEQNQLLTGIARRLSTAPEVFTQGEQDRLAQAVTALALRPDFDATAFDAWLTALRTTTRQAARTRPLTSPALAVVQNNTYFLQALYARLSMETLEGVGATSRVAVLDALRGR